LLFVVTLGDETLHGPGYTYYCYGNCTDVSPQTFGGMVFGGGGTDVDAGFVFLVNRAGGGNIVVLRTGPPGDDAYNSYIYGLAKCQSVSTLIINDTVANEESFVINTILNAEGLYFAGGDQSTYYNIWGTQTKGKITEAINNVVANKKIPVGGTSAGMAVLASIVFTAENGGVDSDLALNLPLDSDITLANDMLVLYPSIRGQIITDMHFVVRDRMGRLVGFLANALHRGFPPAHGFACNEKTSFILDTTSGIGQVVGQGPVYALTPTLQPEVLEKETPLTWYNVSTQRLEEGDLFDFVKFKALDEQNIPYMLNVDDGDLSSTGNGGKIY